MTDFPDHFNGVKLPPHIVHSLKLYVEYRCSPGGFLRAVLENDLVGAISNADPQCTAMLPHIVRYVYNVLPGNTWGNPTRVKSWLRGDTNETTSRS